MNANSHELGPGFEQEVTEITEREFFLSVFSVCSCSIQADTGTTKYAKYTRPP